MLSASRLDLLANVPDITVGMSGGIEQQPGCLLRAQRPLSILNESWSFARLFSFIGLILLSMFVALTHPSMQSLLCSYEYVGMIKFSVFGICYVYVDRGMFEVGVVYALGRVFIVACAMMKHGRQLQSQPP